MILIVDTHSIIHRSFHAFSPDIRTSDGEQVNAVYGTFRLLLQAVLTTQPAYLFAAADLPGGTFRHEAADDYKAGRPKAAPTLIAQIIKIKELLAAMNIPVLAVPGYEADDIIGTLVASYAEQQPITVLSSDNDLLQLVSEDVVLRQPGRTGKTFHIQDVIDKLGVLPTQVADYKALAGDSSDNIKGVKGIGPKAASKLLNEFGDLAGIYARLEEVEEKTRAKLVAGHDDAFAAAALTHLHLGVPLTMGLEGAHVEKIDLAAMEKIFQEMEFATLMAELPRLRELVAKQAVVAERKTLF